MFNEWKIISHYPTLISHLFRNKTQLLIVLNIKIYDRLGSCWHDKHR